MTTACPFCTLTNRRIVAANDLAAAAGVNVPLSLATEAQYHRLVELGHGELDKSGIAELTFPGRTAH